MSYKKRQWVEIGIVVIVCLIGWGISFYHTFYDNEESYYNQARILFSEEKDEIETLYKEEKADTFTIADYFKDSDYSCCLIGLDGRVLAQHDYGVTTGTKLNLTELLQMDDYYAVTNLDTVKVVFPLENKEEQLQAFLVYQIENSKVTGRSKWQRELYVFLPAILATILLVILIIWRAWFLQKRILKPMKEIGDSATAIVEGDYSKAIVSTISKRMLENEVDEVTYGFERMRDELRVKEQREAELKRLQKEVMSCISHDLKTPIATIQAYCAGIKDGVANTKEKQERYLSVISEKAEVLTKMIQDLLDHNNAELNELSIQKKEQYIGSFLCKMASELEIYVKSRGFDFVVKNDVPEMLISFDERRITQVIYNLVDNAVKYMDKKTGVIWFETGYNQEKKRVEIAIRDNGSGIQITDIPYVFNKFYRAEKSRNMSVPGAGLGLSICKYIVEAHGGEIILESSNKEGSSFIFYLYNK